MEVFVLMGEIDYEGSELLGVYASEEEAIAARNVYSRDRMRPVAPSDACYVERRVLGAPADSDDDRRYV